MTALILAAYLNALAPNTHAENLNPSAAKSLEFKEDPKPKATRGLASVSSTPGPLEFEELADEDTEATFCLYCGSTGAARARTLSEQGQDILKHAERTSGGK